MGINVVTNCCVDDVNVGKHKGLSNIKNDNKNQQNMETLPLIGQPVMGYETNESKDHINVIKKPDLDRRQYIRQLSAETKKCIAATHLFGSIWQNFFEDDANQCEYMNKDSDDYFDVLDHILVRGGCNRDVLWNNNFNDVDAAVNTRELNKLHLIHLKKYHSTKETQSKSNCIYWLQYAKKFDVKVDIDTKQNFDDDATGAKIIKSDYMLNANFLLSILQNDHRVRDHLSVAIMGRTKRVWNIRIIKRLMYNGYNLEGFDFDFLDIKHGILALPKDREEANKIHKMNKSNSNQRLTVLGSFDLTALMQKGQYRAMYSIEVQSTLRSLQLFIDDNAMPIDLPIYPLVFVSMSRLTDLTMNTMFIHFSDIIKDKNGKYTHNVNKKTGRHSIDYDWRPKVKDAAMDIDGIKDCKAKNIKTWGKTIDDVKKVIHNQNPKYHIWRVCKLWMKLKGKATMDKKLIDGTIQMYPVWFTSELLKKDDNYAKELANRFINDYAVKGKYDLRFQCLNMLQFHSVNSKIMDDVPNYKKYINQSIGNVSDNATKSEIKLLMNRYGYGLYI